MKCSDEGIGLGMNQLYPQNPHFLNIENIITLWQITSCLPTWPTAYQRHCSVHPALWTAHWWGRPYEKSMFWSTWCMPSSKAYNLLTCVNNSISNVLPGFQQQLALSICSRSHYRLYIHQNKQLFVLIHMFLCSHTKELPFWTRQTRIMMIAQARSLAGMAWDRQQQQCKLDPVLIAFSENQKTFGF